jgi:translocator protein
VTERLKVLNPVRRLREASPSGPRASYVATAVAVTAAALVGSKAVNPRTDWYQSLAKPRWQPPSWAFGVVWTPLYASVAWATGRALAKAEKEERPALAGSLAVNLALNAGWNWVFFRARSLKAGLATTALLDASNAELIRRTARVDTGAAAALLPYAAWCIFATALNTSIARLNPPPE